HGDLSQLRIHLRGPDGTDVVLTDRGATGTSFNWTTFADAATKTLAQGTSPYHEAYRPDGSLGAFAGKNARGTWELWIEDEVAGQTGRLYQFRLIIEASPASVQAMSLTGAGAGSNLVTEAAGFSLGETGEEVQASTVVDAGPAKESVETLPSSPAAFRITPMRAQDGQEARPEQQREAPVWLWSHDEAREDVTVEQLM